jgi:hypothetical protein
MVVQQCLDVGHRTAAHFLVHRADEALLDLLVEALAEHSESLWRRDDGEGVEVVA